MATPTFEDLKVYWATAIANISAPTVAEMTAATDITEFVPVTGVNVASTQNRASLAMLGQSKIQERMGTRSKSPTLTCVRHIASADDDAWNLFDYADSGFLVLAYMGGGTTAGDRVEVYSAEASDPMMVPSAENELQTFTVELAVDAWDVKATVAA